MSDTEKKEDNATDVDQRWEILSVENFIYKKNSKNNFYLSSQIVYKNRNTNEQKKDLVNIDVLYNKVVGNVYDSNDNLIESNIKKNTENLIFEVSQFDLSKTSKILYFYKEFNLTKEEIPSFEKEFLKEKWFYKLHYNSVHLIKSYNDVNGIDYYILPSYEVLRFFFLKGSKLNKFFFQKFLFSKGLSEEWNELYIKKESNEEGNKRHFLITKQGLSKQEYSAISRMAYIKNGFNCIEKIRNSLLINASIKAKDALPYQYKTLYTVLPQDYPFKISCSGNRFCFKNKNYFLIDEIYDTKEHFPIKDIELLFFSDRRRNPNKNSNSNGMEKVRTLNSSKPMQNARLTSEQRGNSDIAANIDITHFNGLYFDDKEEFDLNIVDKHEGDSTNQRTLIMDVPQEILSLLSEIDKNSKNGRTTTTSKVEKDAESEINRMRRKVFYDALKIISSLQLKIINKDQFKIVFFNIDLNLRLNLTEEYKVVKEADEYKITICEINILYSDEYVYLIRSDNNEYDTSRYAYFNNRLFARFKLDELKDLYKENFEKNGLRFKVKDLKNNKYNLKDSFEFHNQSDYDEQKLAKKIKAEIYEKLRRFD